MHSLTRDVSPALSGADEVILVEPDTKRLGWGMATFVGLLQDTEVEPDKEDTRSLYVTVHK